VSSTGCLFGDGACWLAAQIRNAKPSRETPSPDDRLSRAPRDRLRRAALDARRARQLERDRSRTGGADSRFRRPSRRRALARAYDRPAVESRLGPVRRSATGRRPGAGRTVRSRSAVGSWSIAASRRKSRRRSTRAGGSSSGFRARRLRHGLPRLDPARGRGCSNALDVMGCDVVDVGTGGEYSFVRGAGSGRPTRRGVRSTGGGAVLPVRR
jgi:hypothetical protein